MKAITLTLALFVLLMGSAAQAQHHSGRPAASPARQELRTYYQQNVLPVVRQQRQKLEAQLSTSDKAQLAIYRTQLRETRQKGHALRQSLRPADGAPAGTRPALTEAQKQQVAALRTETKGIMQNVALLAQKYEGDIAKLAQEVQPQKEKWATDTKAILARTMSPEQRETLSHQKGRRHHKSGSSLSRYFRPAAFLLLDPNAPATPAAAPAAGTAASVYPNPVTATSQLEYEVKKAGPVSVELLDARGNTLRTVAREASQEKGAHTLPVSLSDLPNGTYYFKITTRSGAETRRFVKE